MSGDKQTNNSTPEALPGITIGEKEGDHNWKANMILQSFWSIELLEESILEEKQYTLNLKRLKVHQIGEALSIHQEKLVTERRKVITSKLEDLIKIVIIQSRDDDAPLFLANKNSVIIVK